MVGAGPALAQQVDGRAYVRAMAADADGDVQTAVAAYANALNNAPDDQMVALRAYREALAAGDEPLATRAAQVLASDEATPPDVSLYLLALAVRDKDATATERLMGEVAKGPFNFMLPSLRAWQAYESGGDPFAPLAEPANSGLESRFNIENRTLLGLATGDVTVASQAIRTLIASGRGSPDLALDGAVILASIGQRDAARALAIGAQGELSEYLRRMGRQKPGMAFALSRMMLRVAGDLAHEDAVVLSIMLTRTGLLLDPLDDRLRLLLADALSRDGADDVALETLAQIPSSSPFDDEARIVSIDVLARAGRTDEALTRAREIATRRGATSDDAQSYGDLLAANDRYDAAAEAYAMAIARAEGADNWVLYVSRGRALDAAGHWDEALAALRQAVALAPNEPVALDTLGRAQIERGVNLAKATALIERAHELRPNDPEITDSLGWAYFLQGDVDRALPLLELAAKAAPGSSEINEHLGDAYWHVGRRFEARYAWQAASVYADAEQSARLQRKISHGPGTAMAAD